MSVYRRGNGWAVLLDVDRDGHGKRVRHYEGGFKTKREAQRAETAARSRLATGTFVSRNSMTVGEYFEQWVSNRFDVRPTTAQAYRSYVRNHIVPRLGHFRLQDLSTQNLNSFFSDLLEGGSVKVGGMSGGPLSATTVRQIAAILHKGLDDALRSGLVVRNVSEAATKPRVQRSANDHIKTWSGSEVELFLTDRSSNRLYAMWVVFATTGMRRGEVLGLHWDDFSAERSTLSVRRSLSVVDRRPVLGPTKTAKGRQIPLVPQTVEALKRWRATQTAERLAWGPSWRNDGFMFTLEDGTPLHPDSISAAFRKVSAQLALPRIRLHDLRHTWATLALVTGVPMKVVSENLGHSSIRVTADIYSHVSPTMAADAVNRVANEIFGLST